jgi:hypothetical protein
MKHIKFPDTKGYFVLYEYFDHYAVVCYLYTRDTRLPIAYGKSECSYKDLYDPRYGRFVALNRALYAARNPGVYRIVFDLSGVIRDYYGPLSDYCINALEDSPSYPKEAGQTLLRKRQEQARNFLNTYKNKVDVNGGV